MLNNVKYSIKFAKYAKSTLVRNDIVFKRVFIIYIIFYRIIVY